MTTLTEKAYEALRHDIVRGKWSSGQQLRMAELSEHYGMGFSPLREALSRLQAEGLTILAPLRGFSVATLSVPEMWDAVNLRILVECEALRHSIAQGDDSWEAGIVSSLHALTRQYERLNSHAGDGLWELENRHHAFHRQLISACGSPRMLGLFERLYVDTERYRIPILLRSTPRRGRDVQREHSEIAEAVLARNATLASRRLTEHYQLTARNIEEQTQVRPSKPASAPRKATGKKPKKAA